jgi:hypothetical protein
VEVEEKQLQGVEELVFDTPSNSCALIKTELELCRQDSEQATGWTTKELDWV